MPDLNTIFYDKAKKRIVRGTEKKVNTGGKKGVMVNENIVLHGTDKYLRLMENDGVATSLSTEDNVDKNNDGFGAISEENYSIERNPEKGKR